eukprot:6180650-Pleurochrysis_carterae.AAC.1
MKDISSTLRLSLIRIYFADVKAHTSLPTVNQGRISSIERWPGVKPITQRFQGDRRKSTQEAVKTVGRQRPFPPGQIAKAGSIKGAKAKEMAGPIAMCFR